MSYWYVPGGDGRRYCYSKEPSFHCPVAMLGEDPEGELLAQAAATLGADPRWLGRRLQHRPERARIDEKLTDTCYYCGHKLERLGFRCWIEAEGSPDDTSVRIARRLGGDGFVQVEGPWYRKTKREAQGWAHMRADEAKR